MIRRFTSRTVRRAVAMQKHVWKLLAHQRDILSPKAVGEVEVAIAELKSVAAQDVDKAVLQKQMDSLEATANKWLKPYPHAAFRENVEMLLVALAVAMAIRTFFLQPFKIPTGSMQPTLFGVSSVPDYSRNYGYLNKPEMEEALKPFLAEQKAATDAITIPTGWERFKEFLHGVSYLNIKADEEGIFQGADQPFRFLIFNIKQTYHFAGKTHTVWFPPDYGSPQDYGVSALEARAGLLRGRTFHKGEDIVKMKVVSGDYLFVDRLTYNFRAPQRGDIVVFATRGIPAERRFNPGSWMIPDDQFYIKRLVGLGGETLQIGDDRHLVVDGHRLDATTPHFENVYSFGSDEPKDSHYSGHVNNLPGAPFLRSGETMTIPKDDFFVMGDNTMSSLDSRFWGSFPKKSVIGRYWMVYWPLTSRLGWNNR